MCRASGARNHTAQIPTAVPWATPVVAPPALGFPYAAGPHKSGIPANPPLYWMVNRTTGKGAKMEIRPMFVVGITLLGSAAAQQPAAPKNSSASPAKAQATAPAKAQPTPAAKLPDAPKSQGSAAFATPKER